MLEEVQQMNYTESLPYMGVYKGKNSGKGYLILKRFFDVLVSFFVGVLLFLPMLVIAAVIKLDSPGPVLFKQERIGKNKKSFIIYKFRTMSEECPRDVATNDLKNMDDYTTRLGKMLRKSSLDELPQIWNVIKGDMSIVGYRPVCLSEKELNDLRWKSGVLNARPGITGYAQVMGRDNVTIHEKAKLDEYYIQNRSIWMDLWCLFKTFTVVLSCEGAK